jgi:hypothetical protein
MQNGKSRFVSQNLENQRVTKLTLLKTMIGSMMELSLDGPSILSV